MGKFNYICGDLITLAQEGQFDVTAHGCNCFCTQGAGIAKGMNAAFGTIDSAKYPLEAAKYRGDINKLGQIQGHTYSLDQSKTKREFVCVYNLYTQFNYDLNTKPFDYEAFRLCMRKLAHTYKGTTNEIGLPKIGCHLAGGDWDIIEHIMQHELKDCNVTIVEYGC